MKKSISMTFCLIVFSAVFIISAVAADNYDFRKTRWDMSPEQVIQSEGRPPSDRGPLKPYDEVILYYGEVGGLDTLYGYKFINNKLVAGEYIFQEDYTNKNSYINNYLQVEEILTRLYGQPISDKATWHNSLYKNDVENYGLAASIGHLTYFNKWTTKSTIIVTSLTGNNYKIKMNLLYESQKYHSLINSRMNQKEEEGL